MRVLHNLYRSMEFLFLNYIISNIPCWHIRKMGYRIFGMKIGKHARINMKVSVFSPNRIKLGDRAVINEFCHLDGRGGIEIGCDSSVSMYSKLITGSHDKSSHDFHYISSPIKICDHVWLGIDAMVLGGVIIASGCVIAAGGVVVKSTEPNSVYAGIPAEKIGIRGEEPFDYKIERFAYFR